MCRPESRRPQLVKLNYQEKDHLPYIELPAFQGKFLIDTGASCSMISPKVIEGSIFDKYVEYEPFEVKTAHAVTRHENVVYLPLPPEFNSDLIHKFLIFDFDPKYKGLIGLDLLKALGTNIDLKAKVLSTATAEIPIRFDYTVKKIKIEPRTERVITVKTNYTDGYYIQDDHFWENGLKSPAAIVSVKNGSFRTTIINYTEEKKIVKNKEPFELEVFDDSSVLQQHELNSIMVTSDIDKELCDNLKRLRVDHMNEEEKREIKRVCYQYRELFYSENLPLTFTHAVKHELRLSDDTPIFVRNYRQPPQLRKEIQNQIDNLLKQGIIRESISPWSCPVHIVPKKADASGKVKWRLVIDYRRLNDRIVEDKYPLPNINDILDKLGRAQYFTTLDLASGYHQVEMHPNDIEKTAFSTERGHYEFLRMPFGLKNAPSTFQRLMDHILRGIENVFTYLDDVIIISTSLQEHVEKLKEVFDRLKTHNLKIQLDKSEFLQKHVNFLGHELTDQGLKPNKDKIKAVLNFPLPATQKDIKAFLGLVGYYRKFIRDFAKITKPMTLCLKKNAKVVHSQEFIDCFNKCKQILTNAPLLQFPDFEQPFILTTDASDVALGSVLSQGPVGSDKPVAYASRTLSETERRYSTIEKELLAIVWAIKYFRPYLYGRKFTIYTDHRPLTWLMSLKDPNSKLMRWRLNLASYDYNVVYKKGRQNTNADALSRVKIFHNSIESLAVNLDDNDDDEIIDRIFQNVQGEANQAQDQPMDLESIRPPTENNADQNAHNDDMHLEVPMSIDANTDTMSPVTQQEELVSTNHTQPDNENQGIPILSDAIDRQLKQFHIRSTPGSTYRVDNRATNARSILKDVFIPVNNTEAEIVRFLKEHTIPDRIFHCYFYDEELYHAFSRVYTTIFNDRGPKLIRCTSRVTLVENKAEQQELIKKYHEGKTVHRGIQETHKHLRRSYHWPNMLLTIQTYINQCDTCLKAKYERNPLKPPLALTETPTKPMQHLFMDLYSTGGATFLTIIDNFSKYAQAVPLSATSSVHIAEALLKVFSTLGLPLKITTDSDTKFENDVIKEICATHNINIHFTTPYNPNSNSPVERFHSTIAEIIRIQRMTNKEDPITLVMAYSIIAYNNSIHSTTGYTPHELLFGHTASRNPLEIYYPKEFYQDYVLKHRKNAEAVQECVAATTSKNKEQIIAKRNQDAEDINFKVGETVYKQVAKSARNDKTRPVFKGPYKVIRLHPNNVAEIIGEHPNSKSIRVHYKLLRRPHLVPGRSSPEPSCSTAPPLPP